MGAFVDMTGLRVGKLLVVRRASFDAWGAAKWQCICDCGTIKEVSGANLRTEHTTSCGCNRKKRSAIDLSGKRFGNLVVLSRVGSDLQRCPMWLCRCDCGEEAVVRRGHLKSGHTKSCGCLALKNYSGLRHGHHRGKPSATYRSWRAMIQRCLYPKAVNYANYGGRGIKVCDRWLDSFENFLADMGERPEGKTLDRYPDPDGNYEPDNCRWATTTQQRANRSSHQPQQQPVRAA